jgi:YggT family protein
MIRGLVLTGIGAYAWVIFLRLILSWFPISPSPTLRPAFNFMYDATEPFLRVFRRLLPPVRLGGGALDLSPLLAFIVLRILQSVLANVLPP